MTNDAGHPLLAQVPLVVSPFISLPTATTLPYTYRNLPSAVPATLTADQSNRSDPDKPAFVVSSTGQAVHPDDIAHSCHKLEKHIKADRENATKIVSQWQEDVHERELAEKRRKAPGWLDRNEKILQPQKILSSPRNREAQRNLMDEEHTFDASRHNASTGDTEGAELDRVFGKGGI